MQVLGGVTSDEARLVTDALVADEPFPRGARGSRLMARAKAAIGVRAPALATLVVRALGDVVEVLAGDRRLGEVVTPVPVRGEGRGGVLVRHRLGRCDLATHVDVRRGDRFVVMLDLGAEAARRQTRIALFKGPREVLSEGLRQGRVLLPELAPGVWHVEVRDREGWVGGLDLVLSNRAA